MSRAYKLPRLRHDVTYLERLLAYAENKSKSGNKFSDIRSRSNLPADALSNKPIRQHFGSLFPPVTERIRQKLFEQSVFYPIVGSKTVCKYVKNL